MRYSCTLLRRGGGKRGGGGEETAGERFHFSTHRGCKGQRQACNQMHHAPRPCFTCFTCAESRCGALRLDGVGLLAAASVGFEGKGLLFGHQRKGVREGQKEKKYITFNISRRLLRSESLSSSLNYTEGTPRSLRRRRVGVFSLTRREKRGEERRS